MMASSSLPLLLPAKFQSRPQVQSSLEWIPRRHLSAPQPPPTDETKQHDQEMAFARQLIDGKAIKKVRPRRTIDYFAGLGRWALLRRTSPSPRYIPYQRPAPPYIIDLLPAKAYPENASTSLCTKFVHTSTNKIRCPVNCVVWTPECRRVLTGSTSGEFTLWNGLTFNFETILQAHDTAIRTMQFTHSGAYLASADQSGVIKYFQPNMNNLTAWNGHREAIRGLSFSPDDSRFATASDDSTLRIWSFAERREERVLTGHGWDVKCVEWHPTKGLLVSGSKDNLIKFWDPRTGTCLSTLHYHKNTVQALAWSPNGSLMASASRDQTLRVFDIRAMKELQPLRGHKKEVCSVAWHPFHPILVSGGSEGSILHWDLSSAPTPPTSISSSGTPSPRATLSQAHDSNVWALSFHSLGHLLVSASNDHTTRFWCRERPGDSSSVFSGGGEKPPEDPNAHDQDDEDDMMVPGFTSSGTGAGWWGQEDEGAAAVPSSMSLSSQPHMALVGAKAATGLGVNTDSHFASTSSSTGGSWRGADVSMGGDSGPGAGDDFIPGFGVASENGTNYAGSFAAPRKNGSLPSQEDMYGTPGNGSSEKGGDRGGRSRWGGGSGGRRRY